MSYYTQRSCLFCDLLCLIPFLWTKVEGYWHEQVVIALKRGSLLETINSLWGAGFMKPSFFWVKWWLTCADHVQESTSTVSSWLQEPCHDLKRVFHSDSPLLSSPDPGGKKAKGSIPTLLVLGNKQHKDTLCGDRTAQIHGNTGQLPGESVLLCSK